MSEPHVPAANRLELETDLTIYHAVELQRRLLDAVRSANSLELDLSRVGEIDSAGFQLLVMAKREAQNLGHHLTLVACSPAVSELLAFYGMTNFFTDSEPTPDRSST